MPVEIESQKKRLGECRHQEFPLEIRLVSPQPTGRYMGKLSEFRGRQAAIAKLDMPDSLARRLKSLGLFEGQSVLVQRAGSSYILTAAGGRVAVAREIAARIIIEARDTQAA